MKKSWTQNVGFWLQHHGLVIFGVGWIKLRITIMEGVWDTQPCSVLLSCCTTMGFEAGVVIFHCAQRMMDDGGCYGRGFVA